MNWKKQSCLTCDYRDGFNCRRFPPCDYGCTGNAVVRISNYPVVYNQLATALPKEARYSEACGEYKPKLTREV